MCGCFVGFRFDLPNQQEGASIGVTNKEGKLPIHYAVRGGDAFIVQMLLKQGSVSSFPRLLLFGADFWEIVNLASVKVPQLSQGQK